MRATANAMASARRLRRNLSLPEQLLWRILRSARGHCRFRRQHPIGPYVADFYCPRARLVVEIDGAAHDARQDRDERRDNFCASIGLTVVRIAAADILADPSAVADGLVRLAEASAGPSTTQPGG
jgi:very-short-patch-repair endonuclease